MSIFLIIRLTFVCMVCAFAPAGMAASPIKAAAKALAAGGSVEVSNIRGAIHITGWERNAVAVTGSLGEDTRLIFEASQNRVVVRAEKISKTKGWLEVWSDSGLKEDTELYLHVPFAASLELESVSADMTIVKIEGSKSLKAETVSGDMDIHANITRLDISSVSGDMLFAGQAERTQAETVSGDIRLQHIQGELAVDTVSGDVLVTAHSLREIDGGSVSGDLEFHTALASNADVKIESMSGDIIILMPSNSNANVHAETFSGSLQADFPLEIIDADGPGSEMQGKLGNGSARIEMDSFSGDIRLRKQ